MPGARRRPRRTTAACAPVASQRDVTAAPPRAARFPDFTPPPASVCHLARPRLGGLRPPGARCWEGVRGAPCAQEGPNGWRRRGVGGSLSFTRRKRGPRPGSRTPRVPGPQGGPARGGPSAHVSEKRRSPAAARAHGGAVCELARLLGTPQERARGRRSPARSRHALLVASLEPSGRHGGQRVARPPPSDPNTGLPASTTASAEQQFPRSPAGRPHGIINCGSPVQQHVLSASDLRARRLRSRTASRAGLMVQKQLSVPLITGQRDAAPTGASSGVEHGLPLPGPQDGPPADAQWRKGSGP